MQRVGVQPLDRVALVRDQSTWLLYGTLGVLGFLLNGLGAVLGPLQRQLGVDRSAVAFYPSLYALALLGVGLLGDRVAVRLGHRRALQLALMALSGGALLLAMPSRPLTVAGALLLGTGGALIVQILPATLHLRHGTLAGAALGEANGVASFAAVLAPIAVALAVGAGAGWEVGYVLPVLPVALALIIGLRRLTHPAANRLVGAPHRTRAGEPGPLLGRWVDVLLAVSVEFCLVFWAADAFAEWHQVGPGGAPALAALFLLGMALARTFAASLTARHHPLIMVLACCAVAGTGFALFWAAASTVVAAAGLLVTGLGVALLYPVTLARVVAAWPHNPDRAAARGALASGLAVGLSPLLLAGLADQVGLRASYLAVPVLLAVLAAHTAVTLTRGKTRQT